MSRRIPNFVSAALAALVTVACLDGCLFEELREHQQALDRQQADIEHQREQLEALRQQQGSNYPTTPAPSGACDNDVMKMATKRGGERFAKGEFTRALGYYSDAARACPGNAEAELNVARAYEALKQPDKARAHYQKAAESASSDSAAAQQAQQALSRMGGPP